MYKQKKFIFYFFFLLLITFSLSFAFNNSNVKANTVPENAVYSIDGVDITGTYGENVLLEAEDKEGKEFLFWMENSKMISTSRNYSVTIYGAQDFKSIYKDTDSIVVVFLDANRDWIDVVKVGLEGTVEEPVVRVKPGYSFAGWDKDITYVEEDMFVYAEYTKIEEQYEEVSTGVSSLSYVLNDNRLALIGQATSENEIVEFGVITSTIGDPREYGGTIQKRAEIAESDNRYAILMNLEEGVVIYVRSYVVVRENGVYSYEYSELATLNEPEVVPKAKVGFDSFDRYVIALPGEDFENDPVYLGQEFLADWNAFTGAGLTDLSPTPFFNSAKAGLTDAIGVNKDLSPSNIYKFFNDSAMKDKWGWFLDYMKPYGAGITHGERQIVAIQGNGTNGDYILYHSNHLSYSIANFFNKANDIGGYTAVNFAVGDKYETVKDFNNKILMSEDNYAFVEVGSELLVPSGVIRNYYTFLHFTYNDINCHAGEKILVDATGFLVPVYEIINYNLRFYDVETLISNLSRTYTYLDFVTLPNYEKPNFSFLGWYDNPSFNGEPIIEIEIGSSGDKVYYAKTAETTTLNSITYELNGGSFYLYNSRADMVNDFMADFNDAFNLNLTASGFQAGTYQKNVFTIFTHSTYGEKWLWMREYIIKVAGDQNHASEAQLIANNDAQWRGSIDSFLNSTVRTAWPASANFSSEPAANGFWDNLTFLPIVIYETGKTLTLPTPVKFGFEFAGWYDNAEFSNDPMSEIPSSLSGDIILYARWI